MSSPAVYTFLRHRIVVAEDDAVTSTLITRTLEGDGHCVSHDPAALWSSGVLAGELPSLCVPFTSEELQAAVRRLLPALHDGTVLALQVKTPVG